MDFIFADPG